MGQTWCHCESCCKWNQVRPTGIVAFPKDSLKVLAGSESIGQVVLTNPEFERRFCKKCGYKLYGHHKDSGVECVSSFNLEDFKFEPTLHSFCEDAPKGDLVRFKDDGLPKWATVPASLGGSDKQIEV